MPTGVVARSWPCWRRAVSEYAYLTELVAHHQEAVAAARQLERSPRIEMREFGAAIVASQSAQIDQMQQWLVEWFGQGWQGMHGGPHRGLQGGWMGSGMMN